MGKVFLGVIAAILVIAIGAYVFFVRPLLGFAEVGAAYGAKSVCSCRFVAERPFDQCLQDFTTDVSQISWAETESAVTASILGGVQSSTARFEPELGCVLDR